jgi:RNA polymerase sigma-70 factor, ECF subfamily
MSGFLTSIKRAWLFVSFHQTSTATTWFKTSVSIMASKETVTNLLLAWSAGDQSALERLVPHVESELRRIASHHMRRENVGHTLQTTALVNELYIKLVDQKQATWHNRVHFFAVAAQLMRRILVDYARRHLRTKRGGGAVNIPLDEVAIISQEKSAELIALDDALERLAEIDPLKAKVVELRHFGGLTVEETAAILKVSEVTVMRHWGLAKSWLRLQVRGNQSPS